MITFPLGLMSSEKNLIVELTPVVWFDASDTSTITQSSGLVSEWADKSGNGRNAVQSNNSFRPTFEVNKIVFPVSRDRFLETSSFSSNILSFAIVERNLEGVVGSAPFSLSSTVAVSGIVFQNNSGLQPMNNTTAYNSATMRIITLATATIGSVNGTQRTLNTSYSRGNSLNIVLSIGRRLVGNIGTSGEIYEIIAFPSDLSLEDRQRVEGYLAHKWSLLANLPSNHPFKVNSP